MSYTINGTDISTIGVRPVQANSERVAIVGIFDFPKRKGTTEKYWGTETEAFVSAADLEWQSRSFVFNAIIEGSTHAELISRINQFKALCEQDLITIETHYGDFNVILDGEISVGTFENPIAIVKASFTEPEMTFEALTKSPSGGSVLTLGGYSLKADFGIVTNSSSNQYSTPQRISVDTTDTYLKTKYRQPKDIDVDCTMSSQDWATFIADMKQFHSLLSSPGLKVFVDKYGTSFNVYVKDGFSVSIKSTENEVMASFTIKLRAV